MLTSNWTSKVYASHRRLLALHPRVNGGLGRRCCFAPALDPSWPGAIGRDDEGGSGGGSSSSSSSSGSGNSSWRSERCPGTQPKRRQHQQGRSLSASNWPRRQLGRPCHRLPGCPPNVKSRTSAVGPPAAARAIYTTAAAAPTSSDAATSRLAGAVGSDAENRDRFFGDVLLAEVEEELSRLHAPCCLAVERRKERLERWSQLQKLLLKHTPASLLETPEGLKRANEASYRVSRLALALDQDSQAWSPEALQALLEDSLLFPSFGSHFYRGSRAESLLCGADAFQGDRQARQYYRNQLMRLYFESNIAVNSTWQLLWEVHGESKPGWDGQMVIQGVMHLLDPDELPESVQSSLAERTEDATEDEEDGEGEGGGLYRRRFAAFGLEQQKYPYLVAWGKDDFVFARPANITVEEEEVQAGEKGESVTAEGVGSSSQSPVGPWFLGRTLQVAASQEASVSAIVLELHPLSHDVDVLEDFDGASFELAPVDMLPTVLRRECSALSEICQANADRAGSDEESELEEIDRDPSEQQGFQKEVLNMVFGSNMALTCSQEPPLSDQAKELRADVLSGPLVEKLNGQQRQAVAAAMREVPLTMIQGPPGTGKTTVCVSIIEAWLAQDPDKPILVATGTHTARAIISRALKQAGYTLASRRPGKQTTQVTGKEVPVYVETVYMAASPRNRYLPRVLIDESAQITEIAGLVALAQGCEKLVLVGDTRQLGAPSMIGHFDAEADGVSQAYAFERQSLFERVQKRHGMQPLLLDTQYRMDPLLSRYPAKRFYGGKLIDGPCEASEEQKKSWKRGLFLSDIANENLPSAVRDHPLVFVDTSKCPGRFEETVTVAGSTSVQNSLEAEVIMRLCRRLQELALPPTDLAVLSPYGAQRSLIEGLVHPGQKSQLSNRKWERRAARILYGDSDPFERDPDPKVQTVDGFQGCEKDFIIFSAVRSNREGKVGFAGDPRRLCVMLTRAKKGLIIVGDRTTLEQDEEWRSWFLGGGARFIDAADAVQLPLHFRESGFDAKALRDEGSGEPADGV